MHLLPYYIIHTFVNAVKKLFRTWVAVFLGIVVLFALFGGVVGYVAGSVIEDETVTQEEYETEPMTAEDRAVVYQIIDLVSGAVILAILLWNIYNADKAAKPRTGGRSVTALFTLADANFLFPSPNQPQTVLLFRTVLQMGLVLLGSVYLIFQLPNLILNLGLSPGAALSILLAWAAVLFIGKLINIFCYCVTATKPRLKKYTTPVSLGVLVLAAALYALRFLSTGSYWQSAVDLFASPVSRLIPIWGWIKGIIMFAVEGEWWYALACTAVTLVAGILFIYLIWHIKVDFYEDALQSAQECHTKQTELKSGKKAAVKHREKERKDRPIGYGEGAAVLFSKNMLMVKSVS